ncbi:hypothetical protein ACTA71_007687 [Dictyostelium dimigraforme]
MSVRTKSLASSYITKFNTTNNNKYSSSLISASSLVYWFQIIIHNHSQSTSAILKSEYILEEDQILEKFYCSSGASENTHWIIQKLKGQLKEITPFNLVFKMWLMNNYLFKYQVMKMMLIIMGYMPISNQNGTNLIFSESINFIFCIIKQHREKVTTINSGSGSTTGSNGIKITISINNSTSISTTTTNKYTFPQISKVKRVTSFIVIKWQHQEQLVTSTSTITTIKTTIELVLIKNRY